MAERPPPGRLPGPVKGLSLVSLFNDFASEMVYPVLPAFITGPLGGSALALGALDGAADLTAAMLRWVSGRLADRKGWTRPLIVAGYGVAILARPLIAVASAAWQVVGFRVIDRMGKGLRSPARDAVISRLTEPRLRGRAFGFNRAADHFGAVLGSVIAWALLQGSAEVREVIGWSAVPGLLALLVLPFALRGINGQRSTVNGTNPTGEEGRPVHRSPFTAHRSSDASGRDYWIPVALLVMLTVFRLPETLLLLRLQQLGVPIAVIPLAWAGLHVVRSVSAYPGGWLTDRLGARWGFGLATAMYIGVALLLAAGPEQGVALVGFLLLGTVAGLSEPAERVAVAALAPQRTGRGFGTYQAVAGLAALPAGVAFGWIYAARGAAAAMVGSSILLGAAMLFWIGAGRRIRVPGSR